MSGNYKNNRANELFVLDEYLQKLIQMDKFSTHPEFPSRINVNIKIPKSTLEEFPAWFYQTTEAKEYILANPDYEQGYDLAYAYPFNWKNVFGMVHRGVEQTYWRTGILKKYFGLRLSFLFLLYLVYRFFISS